MASAGAQNAPVLQPLILDVHINGQEVVTTHPLLRRGTQLLFEKSELNAWQLVVPASPALSVNGSDYYELLAVPGIHGRLDEATQTVNLEVPAEAFRHSVARTRSSAYPPVSEAVLGAFLNYDLALQRDRSGTHPSGYFDAAVSGAQGLVVASFVAGQSVFAGSHTATRLDSYYRFDNPDALTRLTVGDAIARSAVWSTPFRFGGVQFGTNFGLQPGYVSYPTPTLRASSSLPSAIEVFVNDTLRYQGRADAGPFSVPNVPVLTGSGEMRFAVTDTLGVQHVVTTPYYVSSQLLRPGLSDYSAEFGWNRLYYGDKNFDYGRPFGAGTWRKGIDQNATVELHGETSMASQTAGGGITWVMAPLGEFAVHAAASHSGEVGGGRLLRTAYTRSSNAWSFAVNRQTTSRNFTQVGWQDTVNHVADQTQAFAGRSFGRYGSLGSSYTQLRYNTGEQVSVLSVNWSITVVGGGSLGAYVARTNQKSMAEATVIGLTFTIPLGQRQTASQSLQRLAGHTTSITELDRPTPTDIDGGYGCRMLAGRDNASRSEASLDWLGRYGTATVEASNSRGDTAVRVRTSGAIGTAGGLLFAARQSNDAFALVTVPGADSLNIYKENQHLATTDSQGRAILSGLRAYETNRISINSEDLPLEALIGQDVIQLVPRYKGVATATFDITRYPLANIVVRLADGQPLPPGIEVRSAGRAVTLLSGYAGALSIDAPRANEHFEARWRSGHCTFALGPLDQAGQPAQTGDYVCVPLSGTAP